MRVEFSVEFFLKAGTWKTENDEFGSREQVLKIIVG
jgi:hypothetical protein